jgi:CO dehydrogenase nickel-insertion accessory protein CooC1
MEAGIGTVLRLQPGQIDLVLVVAEPSAKAIDIAARSARIAERRAAVVVLANKVRGSDDIDLIRSGVGEREVVSVPADPAVEEADRRGVAPIDLAPDSPAVRALVALGERLS